MPPISQDPTDVANFDPFSVKPKGNGADAGIGIATAPGAPRSPASTNDPTDVANFDPFQYGKPPAEKTSALGSALRGVIGGAAPGIGSLPAIAAGAEAGSLFGPLGGFAGGIAGAYFGGEGIATAQSWLLNKVPKLRDLLGQGEEQKRLDEQEHPIASFLGGIAPFAITMSPAAVAPKTLAENATAWQRLAASPYTARLFSGGVMGGMQLGQEAASEDKINWNRVAVATGFGMIFNKPNHIGEAISEYGARPTRMILGIPHPTPARPPTLAEVSADGVGGPGITESVFNGSEQRNPVAEESAIRTASIEDGLIGPIRRPDLDNLARQKEPEIFKEYDDLRGRQQALRSWIEGQNEPKPFQFLELEEKRTALEQELAEHVAARNGYDRGPRARQIKAQIREVQAEHDALTERAAAFKAGTAVETPDLAIARKHLMDADIALRDLQPRIQGAYRAAAEYAEAPTVAPPPEVAAPPPTPTTETPAGAPGAGVAAGAAAQPIDEQRAFIIKAVTDQMLAAGRPAEEAQATGVMAANYYVARAARFGGAKGSAIDIYKREGPKIRGGRYGGGPPDEGGGGGVTVKPAPGTAEVPEIRTKEDLAAFLRAGGEIKAAPKGGAEAAPTAELRVTIGEGGREAAVAEGQTVGIVTQAMKADLAARGYTPEQIRNLRPQEAHDILSKPAPVTTEEVGKYLDLVSQGKREEAESFAEHTLAKETPRPAGAATEWQATNYGTQRIERPGFKGDVWKDQFGEWHWIANDFRVGMGKLIKGDKVPTEAEAKSAAIEAIEKEGGTLAAAPAAESPQQAWQSLLDMRREIEEKSRTETGYNKKTTRRGAQIRQPARQAWVAGNVVDVGFVKDLLVSEKADDGTFTLLAKPDAEGKSQSYTLKAHGGLATGDKVDFIEAAKPLIEKAAAEPLPEVVAKKKGAARGPRATPPEKMSLLQFIADNGGIQDGPLIRKIFSGGNPLVPGWGRLIRTDGTGKSLDRHLEAAMEGSNGYLEKGSDLKDLERLIDAEGNRKQKQWRIGVAPPEKAIDIEEQRHRMNSALDEHLERLGNKPEDVPPELRDRVLEIMERGGKNPEVAWEEAVTQEQQNAAEAGEIKLEPKGLAGWDEPLPNEPGAAPTGGTETPPREQPEGANAREAARIISGSDREPAQNADPLAHLSDQDIADFFQSKKTYPESEKIEAHQSSLEREPGQDALGLMTPSGRIFDTGGGGQHQEIAELSGTTVHDVMREGTARIEARGRFLGIEIGSRPTNQQIRSLLEYATNGLYDQFAIDIARFDKESPFKEVVFNGDVTPKIIRDKINEAFGPGPEPTEFEQGHRGSIRFTEGTRAIITLLRGEGGADASTIVHELGHAWLEDMARDAADAAAPQWLRDDMATVLRDLKIASPEILQETTKRGQPSARARNAHEKFARSFERYLYEGVAPTPELANVFQRFRAWLLDIYKNVRDLVQISPAIRSVFDRMLAEQPSEAIAAGPRPPGGPTIQDIHEADAKATEPAEGEQAAARVIDERDRYEKEQPPEIKAELEAGAKAAGVETGPRPGEKPPGEGAAVPGGPSEVVRGGGAAEPIAPGGRGGTEPSKVIESSADLGPEGTTIPGTGARPSSATERDHPLAPGPAPDTLPRGDDKAVNKSGNIIIPNVTNREEVGDVITKSGELNDEFKGVRGASVNKGMLWDLASLLGMNPDETDLTALQTHLEKLTGGMKDMAQKVLAARRMLKQSAEIVADLMKKVSISDSDDEAAQLALAITRHDMIQSAISGATASWGRTGTAFHDISEGWDQVKNVNALLMAKTGRTLFQIKQIAKLGAQYETTAQISQFVRDSAKPKFGRMITEYWINGLISGIQTHMTYSIGNTILAMEKLGPETMAAAGIGALRKAMGRPGETVRLGEVAAGLRGARAGFWPAVQSALEAARSGVTTLLPGEAPNRRFMPPLTPGSELIKAGVLNEAATFQDVTATMFSIMRGLRAGITGGAALQRAGGLAGAPLFGWEYTPLGAIPNFQVRGVTMLPTGELARAPSRMIAAIHSFFRPLNYAIEIHQQAYREAANANLTGAAFDSAIAARIKSPTDKMMEDGHNASNDLTLMGAGGQFTRRLSQLVNSEFLGRKDPNTGKIIPGTGIPLLKFVDPFIHISSNIINQSIVQRSPVGLLSSSLRADLMGARGNIVADTAAARMLAGTALSLLFGGLAAEGYITGSEPSNREEAAVWRQVYQAHSVKIGDVWYDMHRLGPMGMLLSVAADLYDVAHHADQGDFVKAAASLQHAVTQNILDESFMRGPSDLIKAIEDPARYGESYVKNFVSSFIPYSVAMSQMARASDPYSRDARSTVDAIKAKVPGLSQSLMPRRDVWGEILPSRESLGPPGLLAIWEQRFNDDPVNKAMLNLGIFPAAVGRKIRNVELTPEQYDDWSRIAGRLAKLRMNAIVQSPTFANMPPYLKHDLIAEQLRQSREVARNMMFMKYPSILVDAHSAKMQKRMAIGED